MRCSTRFARRRATAPAESADVAVDSPEDAVTAVMLSMAPTEPPQLLFLFCDADRSVGLAVSVSGAGPSDAPHAAECVLSAAEDRWSTALVVGLVLPGESTELSVEDLGALLELSEICDDVGLPILEVVVVAGPHWRSVLSLVVGRDPWGNNGDQ